MKSKKNDSDNKVESQHQDVEVENTKCVAKNQTRYIIPGEDFYLTEREYQCLLLLNEKVTAKNIAEDLNLATRTVEFYLKMLRDKSNSKNKAELIRFINKVKNQLIMTTVKVSA